jgi:CubicO group peptidase (beta-lactamase class C family)
MQNRFSFRFISFFLLLLFTFSFAQAQADLETKLKEIDAYAQKARADWNVPGFAIAIVKDDKAVFAKGYGVRELGKTTLVDEHTLFAIASNSKAFTAAALAILIDEKKLSWDDPVTKYLPEFQMYDPYVTREMTIRDLISHRSGLVTFGGDLLWYQTTYKPEEILYRIRFLKPAFSFRARYGYQNIMFLAAGMVVEKVSGMSWSAFVKEKFFKPLGMTSSNTSIKEFKPNGNIATPHNAKTGSNKPIPYDDVDNVAPAASINSCVADLAQWMRLQLGRGTFEGKQFFSRQRSWEMWQPNTVIPISEAASQFNPTRHFSLYGLGWALSDYQGRKIVSHGGGLDGMISQTALMPEENLGVVVLTNSESPLNTIMQNKVFDVFLNVTPKRDWSAELLERDKRNKEAEAKAQKEIEASRVKDTKPSLALEKYTGTYISTLYGDAKIEMENGKLVLRLVPAPTFVADLEHWHYDTFRLTWRDSVVYPFPKGFVTFTLNAQGQTEQMKIDCPNADFNFDELEFKRK